MRVLKWIGIVLVVLVLLVGAGVAWLVTGGDPLIASLLQKHGSTFLGREVRIGGNFDIQWGRPIRIIAEDVHVANAKWGTGPELFSSRRLELDVEPWPLLRFQYVVPRLALDGTVLFLETNENGEGNWQFFAAKAATPQERTGFPELHKLEVQESKFTWHNGQTKATSEIEFAELGVEAPDLDSPVEVKSTGTFQKKPYTLAATVGPLATLQDPKEPYPVKLVGEIDANKLSFEGHIAEPLDFVGVDLATVIEGKDLQKFLQVFSIPVPQTPAFRIAGQLRNGENTWEGQKLDFRLGQSRLGGGILIDVSGKKPYIKTQLVAQYADLADFKGFLGDEPQKAPEKKQEDTKARKEGQGRVIPDTPLPTEQLAGFNADVSIDAPRVKPTAGLPFERVTLVFSLKDKDLQLKPLSFAMANGEVNAKIRWNASLKPGQLEADIDLRRFDLEKFFAGMDVPKMAKETAGIVGGKLKIKSRGGTQREAMANADGELLLFMERGRFSKLLIELFGLDVAEALGFLVEGDQTHPINCLVGNFEVKQGVATSKTFILDTTDTVIDGSGNINLADETIYLDLVPHPKDWSPLSLRTPVELRGTFGAPKGGLRKRDLAAKLGAAIGLGVVAPPAALLPLIETGLGEKNYCSKAFAAAEGGSKPETREKARENAQPPAGAPAPKQGSGSGKR